MDECLWRAQKVPFTGNKHKELEYFSSLPLTIMQQKYAVRRWIQRVVSASADAVVQYCDMHQCIHLDQVKAASQRRGAAMPSIVDPTVPVVKNVLLLDSEGKRIAVKYYSNDWCATSHHMASACDGQYNIMVSATSKYRDISDTSCLCCMMQAHCQCTGQLREGSLCKDQQNTRSRRRCEGLHLCPAHACSVLHFRTTVVPDVRVTLCCPPPAAEITMFDDVIVVYKFIGDLMFFVTGSQDENELILCAGPAGILRIHLPAAQVRLQP